MAADVDLCRQCNHDRKVILTNLGKAIVQHILPKKHFDQFGQMIGKDKHWFCEKCLSVVSGTYEEHCSTDQIHKDIREYEILSAATETMKSSPQIPD